MADSIPVGTPAAPQARKQVMTPEGVFVPVVEELPAPKPLDTEPSGHVWKIGDKVALTGRVIEVQHPQGGQVSVKVQMPNGSGWFRGHHLDLATTDLADLQKEHADAMIAHKKELAAVTSAHEKAVAENATKAKTIEDQNVTISNQNGTIADQTAQISALNEQVKSQSFPASGTK